MESDQRGRRNGPVIEISNRGQAVVVRLGGELDLSNAARVRHALLAVAGDAPERVVVDLAEVEFMDSSTLAVLLEGRSSLRPPERFLLAAPALEARRALEISGLDRYFRVHATVDEALTATL